MVATWQSTIIGSLFEPIQMLTMLQQTTTTTTTTNNLQQLARNYFFNGKLQKDCEIVKKN
jgi:hypothetical protein